MPSPFPGMDPFVENPDYFPCLHSNLITHRQELTKPIIYRRVGSPTTSSSATLGRTLRQGLVP